MANSEKLGTCDRLGAHNAEWFPKHQSPHYKQSNCVNWREQPQEPSRCPIVVPSMCPHGIGRDSGVACAACENHMTTEELLGVVKGLEDMQAGRTKPFDQISRELEASEGGRKPLRKPYPDESYRDFVDDPEPATPAQGAPTEMCACGSGREPLHPAHGPAASPRSGMGAREFAAEHVEWLQRITPTGSSKAENDPFAFAEAYAADQVRQADQTSFTRLKMEINLRRKAEAEVEKLRQERDADEQMWRERCDAASKAGYEVAMEQEREARERAEGALREIVHSVGKLAEESGEDWRLKHAELMDAYAAGALAVKSSEGEAK